ncbi:MULTISPECIES: FAD-dependent oxidoreductase [Roseobacteraceae]|uniref:Sulfide-quinone reductase n=1 Tax=Celeribacter baekdonensis B30 TaxID=1208323 RepID=K2JS93_9RHOB|nr:MULTISPECIES: FAD-dependent oxidoreductase [Roseobacteraceae]EKE73234.1 Sulfide-quinone reductase [Celeribacter baekdonensis B30]KAB6714408.1 pyridine nucleotide-disulfide oxidoreductase [Roseobacter sp. TSBP12]|tara:strand:- start:5865 stop:6998 length:1134 start_codon:yes stop_codon:yes gene_type:complete
MTHIMILGSGFGALTAVREIRKAKIDARITVVSPNPHLTYLPSLIWMPSGIRTAKDIDVDLSRFFVRERVDWHEGRVVSVSDNGRRVETDTGTLTNDHLIIATGGRYLKKLPGLAEHAIIPCEGAINGQIIHDRIRDMAGGTIALGFGTNPKEPQAVRGGPMFEFLFGIDTMLRQQGRRDRFKLVFFNGSDRPGQRLGDRAVEGLLNEMRKRDVSIHIGAKPIRIEADKVVTEREEILADLVLFMSGLTGPTWLDNTDLPRSEGGFIQADEKCRVVGWPDTYVVGDTGSYPGPSWLAKQAHQADLQAEAAVANIGDVLAGREASHDFKAELVCIVDSVNKGILVFRNEKRAITLPSCRVFHWAKRYFEWHYLRAYRR